jgi:cadmium resistance protein CadD (predicted permease)
MSLVLQMIFPLWLLGGLGIIPIIFGLRGESEQERDIQTQRGWLMVLFVYLAGCGADNLAVYMPVLATMTLSQMIVAGMYFLGLTWLSLLLANQIRTLPMISAIMDKWGEKLTRVIYIAIGLYVIWESGFMPELSRLVF